MKDMGSISMVCSKIHSEVFKIQKKIYIYRFVDFHLIQSSNNRLIINNIFLSVFFLQQYTTTTNLITHPNFSSPLTHLHPLRSFAHP
jgi:hypothetical protein